MEIDLAHAPADLLELAAKLRSQVCIIGGGIAGLTLAHRLMRAGKTVTLLEAGGLTRETPAAGDPFGAELRGYPHAGTREGRVRALGGCSLTWGGQLLPLPEDASWPVSSAQLRPELPSETHYDAQAFFAAQGGALPPLLSHLPELTPRLSHFVPFAQRNLARTLGRELRASPRVQVVLHAAVTELLLAPAGDRIAAVEVSTPDRRRLRLDADQIVLAAGTVENCRLLLASRSVAQDGVGNNFRQVGLYFHDHLTQPLAEFTGEARRQVLADLRPWVYMDRFPRLSLYSLKLEPNRQLRADRDLLPAMAHLTVEEPEEAGVGVLRALLRAEQGGSLSVALRTRAKALPRAMLEALRLEYEARVHHRRYVSEAARVTLQINVAQEPDTASRVLLGEARDELGMPKAVVDWRISDREIGTFSRFGLFLRRKLWKAGVREGVRCHDGFAAPGQHADRYLLHTMGDARHAMGGARMGLDPRTSVVDPELRVHRIANLSVASAAVFPDGSAQLPTETLMRLCERLAERLERELV